MPKTPDFNAFFNDFKDALPIDTKAMEGAFKSTAALNERLAKVAITAATDSAEISTAWTQDTISKLGTVVKAKEQPADYAKDLTDFATVQAETAAKQIAAFTEVAKKVQSDTMALLMAAAEDVNKDATAAVKKASDTVAKSVQKVAVAAK